MNKIKSVTVFDCDPGIDDSFALFLVKKLKIKVDYLVATFGNCEQKITSRNLELMSEYLSLGGELVNGCECSLDGTVPDCKDFHGSDGLGELANKFQEKFPPKKKANIDYKTLSILLENFDEIIYYAVGPLTTIATIISLNPQLKNKIKKLYIMGGGIEKFNKENDTEYNFYSDGKAVKKILESGMNITIFPLDLTMNYGVRKSVIDEFESSTKYPELITMLKYNFEKNMSFGNDFAVLHDTLPVLYSKFPGRFSVRDMQLIADEYGHIEPSQNGNKIHIAVTMEEDLLVNCLKKYL